MKTNISKRLILLITLILFVAVLFQNSILAIPEEPTIIFGEPEYSQGDIVSITLHSDSGSSGKTVDGFLVNIYYGNSGIDNIEGYDSKYISASGNAAQIEFRAAKSDTYITVEASAFENPASQGGIPSEQTVSQVWIKDAPAGSNNQVNDQTTKQNNTPGFGVFTLLFAIIIIIIKREKIKI